jgi:hypothetical protein
VRVYKPLNAQDVVRLTMNPFGGLESEGAWSRNGVVGIRLVDAEHHRVAGLISSALNEPPM